MLSVIKPGIYASIQDGGRKTYRGYGVPVSGPMDDYAFHYSNKLLGNKPNTAAIEIIYGGIECYVEEDVDIAITGANFHPLVNGKPVPMWQCIRLYEGEQLTFQGSKQGSIAYLAMSGGIDSPVYLGSQSVYSRAGLGEILKTGDTISSFKRQVCNTYHINPRNIPTYTSHVKVRVIPSHHEALFSSRAIQQFYSNPFQLMKMDRMGAILKGDKALTMNKEQDIISEAVTFGTIQVPPHGQPMILLADAQTTGGYPTIGTILSDDLWRVTQIQPQGHIRFKRYEINT
ncbi:biotin-dependent carboxyltransferase family protein [Tenuibacillus multivorans]|uniref:Biotin-dependent carboxylase uncharacterized domain-containing protein n=1 Tax=Tenuibacillus multivorans TaxID=237069 RepID=A0A1H0EKI7_9BACI|nr:biotin-dependent carboxyltransferase family protein [Tenuibacillus multivorans]GEL77122.1 urea carboxylase [Tenuibacillus multivorans]SDN82816.1 biotin-dependent carboxylase uncharacterized domain-containing protein [Tenuibacillus multivorans]